MIITYDPVNGYAVPDGLVEEHYLSLLASIRQDGGRTRAPVFSTANIFDRIRCGIAEGDISHEDIHFQFDGRMIQPNRFGAIVVWPEGFCESYSARILNSARMKMKKEHEQCLSRLSSPASA